MIGSDGRLGGLVPATTSHGTQSAFLSVSERVELKKDVCVLCGVLSLVGHCWSYRARGCHF